MKPLACLAFVALSATAAGAQQVLYRGAMWPAADRTDLTRMPADSTPPPVQETLAVRPPGGPPPQLPPPVTTPRVPLALALELAQTVVATCQAQGLRVAAAVTDADGVLQVGLSAEGASPPGRIYGGVPKAVAAAAFRKPTSELRAYYRANPDRAAEVKRNMLLLPGGLPVIANGTLLGAVGVSGASADQDEVCAKAGLAKIQSRLK